LQDDIVRQVAGRLQLRLTSEDHRASRQHTDNPEAYQLYLRGRFYWNKRTEESIKKASLISMMPARLTRLTRWLMRALPIATPC